MCFKGIIAFYFFVGLVEAAPLGLVIRPNLFYKAIDELNRAKQEDRPIAFEPICFENQHYLELAFSAQWTQPKWQPMESNQVRLSVSLSNFIAKAKYFPGCKVDPVSKKAIIPAQATLHGGELQIQNADLAIIVDPQTMHIKFDRSRLAIAASGMTLKISDFPDILDYFNPPKDPTQTENTSNSREALIGKIMDVAEEQIQQWLVEKLRGFVFVQSAGEALKDNPIWNSGPLMQKGAITLELVDRSPSQQFLTFAFNPFRQNSTFSSASGLEIYFNANFLTMDSLRQLSGLNPASETSSLVLDRTRLALANPAKWLEADFTRPPLTPSTSDLSLVIPTQLLNDAWGHFYREQLLKLRTTINVGKQTKGIIANEEHDDYYVITINPQSAPRMTFEANKFRLEVEDYVMDFGNWIEDRLIPRTQIQSKVSVSAALKVDAKKRMVKMLLDPSQFDLELKDLKNRFTPDSILLFQNMANTIWKDFFKTYAEFEVFPTIIDPGNFPIEIQDVSVNGSSIILDVNLRLRGATQ